MESEIADPERRHHSAPQAAKHATAVDAGWQQRPIKVKIGSGPLAGAFVDSERIIIKILLCNIRLVIGRWDPGLFCY